MLRNRLFDKSELSVILYSDKHARSLDGKLLGTIAKLLTLIMNAAMIILITLSLR